MPKLHKINKNIIKNFPKLEVKSVETIKVNNDEPGGGGGGAAAGAAGVRQRPMPA
jgi:hypothetical protein